MPETRHSTDRVKQYWNTIGAQAPDGCKDHWVTVDGMPLPETLFSEVAEYVISQIPTSLGAAQVLEVGCGTGKILKALQHAPSLSLWGCDLSEEQVKHARVMAPKAQIEVGDVFDFAANIPKGQTFDTIFVHGVTQYFPGDAYFSAFLEKCADLLTAGGSLLLIDTPIDWYYENMRGIREVTPMSVLKGIIKKAIRYKSRPAPTPDHVTITMNGTEISVPTFDGYWVKPDTVEVFAKGRFANCVMEYQLFQSKPISYRKFRPILALRNKIENAK